MFTLEETETESDKNYLVYNCVKVFILLRDRGRVRYKFPVGSARISSVSVSVSVSVNEPLAMQYSVAYTGKLPKLPSSEKWENFILNLHISNYE